MASRRRVFLTWMPIWSGFNSTTPKITAPYCYTAAPRPLALCCWSTALTGMAPCSGILLPHPPTAFSFPSLFPSPRQGSLGPSLSLPHRTPLPIRPNLARSKKGSFRSVFGKVNSLSSLIFDQWNWLYCPHLCKSKLELSARDLKLVRIWLLESVL